MYMYVFIKWFYCLVIQWLVYVAAVLELSGSIPGCLYALQIFVLGLRSFLYISLVFRIYQLISTNSKSSA